MQEFYGKCWVIARQTEDYGMVDQSNHLPILFLTQVSFMKFNLNYNHGFAS